MGILETCFDHIFRSLLGEKSSAEWNILSCDQMFKFFGIYLVTLNEFKDIVTGLLLFDLYA